MHIASYNAAVVSLPANQKIVATVMDVEEEEKESNKQASPTKERAQQLKEIISKDNSMGLPVKQIEIEHFCEVISGIFALFTSGILCVIINIPLTSFLS